MIFIQISKTILVFEIMLVPSYYFEPLMEDSIKNDVKIAVDS